MNRTIIKVTSFDPFTLALPDVDGKVSGEVTIEVPPVHIKVREFLGPEWGFHDQPYIGGDLGCGWTVTIPDDAPVDLGTLVQFAHHIQDELRKTYDLVQGHFDESGALLPPVM